MISTQRRTRPTTEAPPKPRSVALSRIVEDPAIQPRLRMSRDAISRYANVYRNNRRDVPPILCGTIDRREGLILIDGYHRVQAARRARLTALPALIVETTLPEAKWLAVEANLKHGVPLTRAEGRTVFQRFVRAGKNRHPDGTAMSSRELARALPLGSHQSMLNWMKQDFPEVHAEMTGCDPEEDTPTEDEGTRAEDQLLTNVEWTEGEYLAAIRKAAAEVPKEKIAEIVHDIRERVAQALGVADIGVLLPEQDDNGDF